MTKELIEDALRWANGHPNRRSSELMRALADALAAVPDAATENVQKMYERACADIQEYSETIKRLEAERDAALAAIERVRAVAMQHRSVEQHNEMVPVTDIADLIREPSSADYLVALDGAPEPEWEYGLSVQAWRDEEPEPHPSREAAQHVIDNPDMYRKWTHDNPVTMHRRRKAGPWLPVEGESKP